MNFLKWYSVAVVSITEAALFVEVVNGSSDDASFWGMIIFAPIAYYLWKIALEPKVEVKAEVK